MGLSAVAEDFLTSSQPIFNCWNIQSIIGEGSSGTVYEISDNCGNRGALKVIEISNGDNDSNLALAFSSEDIRTEGYINEMTADITEETGIMHSLRGKRGIVGCSEYGVLEMNDGNFKLRLILIRMELLQSLNKIMRSDEVEFTSKDVAKMGIDLCSALVECRKQNIIHRDIKPSNVFINSNGEYQLGDFGSAKMLEHTMMASRKGTLAYIAPEIASGQPYNAAVDLYSLGIMMYQLLNGRRLPLLEENFKFSDMEIAIEKRLNGCELPPPCGADAGLGEIICKMCAYSPKERYSSPEECMEELQNYILLEGKYRRKLKFPKKLTAVLTYTVSVGFVLLLAAAVLFFIKSKTDGGHTAYISSGNVNSAGMIACDDDWIYTSCDASEKHGYRIAADGGQKQILCGCVMYDVNITDKYVIFSSDDNSNNNSSTDSDKHGLYRMEKDGSNLTCLAEGRVLNPIAYGKYVYYIVAHGDFNTLCRIPIEGGRIDELGVYDKYTYHFYPDGGYIYIYDYAGKRLIKTDVNGNKRQTIIETSIMSFCIDQGKLYFVQADYNELNQICVCNISDISDEAVDIDGDKVLRITAPSRIYAFNAENDEIYFSITKASPQNGIWHVNDNGSGMCQLHRGNTDQIQIVGKQIYFREGKSIYNMNTDGTDMKKMFDISSGSNNYIYNIDLII